MANAKKSDKKKVANRLYIDATGKVTKDEMEATGVRYESLGPDEKTVVATTEIKDLTKINPKGLLLLALFGAKTWIGNLYNQELDQESITARVDTVIAGEWPEREAFGGPRYDAEALATAIARAKGQTDPAPFAKRIAEEKGYPAMALKVPAVLAHYNEITGKAADVSTL